MRRSTPASRTSDAPSAVRSKPSTCSTVRARLRLGGGPGIHSASNAVEPRVETTAPGRRICETPAYARGARKTPPRPQRSIIGAGSGGSMISRRNKSQRCAARKAGDARYVSAAPAACLWITATPKATFVHCSARPATPSSAGTKRRPTPSFDSNATSRHIAADKPCHADVLLEIANGPLSDGALERQGKPLDAVPGAHSATEGTDHNPPNLGPAKV